MTTKDKATILSIYNDYSTVVTSINNNSMLKSVLVRYITSGLGGPSPKGQRATANEIKNAEEFLQKMPSTCILDLPNILEKACEEKGVDKSNRKAFRSILKSFVEWAISQEYCDQHPPKTKKSKTERAIQFRRPIGQAKVKPTNYHGQTQKEPYALMARHCKKSLQGQLIYPEDYINEELEKELKEYKDFRLNHNNCSPKTVSDEFEKIYQFLGWFHRYKGIPLSDLRLQLIIPFRKLIFSISESFKDGQLDLNLLHSKKSEALQLAINEANESIKLISEYINFYAPHPNSKMKVITTCVPLAKFIFRNEIGTDDYPDKSDIPIIRRLYSLGNQLREKKKKVLPAVPHYNKSVPWEVTFEVLEKLRKKANIHFASSKTKKYIYERKRSTHEIFNDLQRFLSLGFMILMPPNRSRTYYDLEIGRSFVKGNYEKGLFTPSNKMKDSQKAAWYIHLEPTDYKTGVIYGEWWGKLPNIKFGDGSLFYEYIDLWLTQGREYKQKCNHNFFFRGSYNYKNLDEGSWSIRIINIFLAQTDIPVTPKELRKMYVTYIYDNGATDAEKDAAAYAMHHSRQMQSVIYNEQEKMNKLAPIYEFNERIIQKFFNN